MAATLEALVAAAVAVPTAVAAPVAPMRDVAPLGPLILAEPEAVAALITEAALEVADWAIPDPMAVAADAAADAPDATDS